MHCRDKWRGILAHVVVIMLLAIFSITEPRAACPSLENAQLIWVDGFTLFAQEFCYKKRKVELSEIKTHLLPHVMDKEFLGVAPPSNWELFANEIIQQCDIKGDVCSKTVRNKIASCFFNKFTNLFFVLGPWYGENCERINEEVFSNWSNKRENIKTWITLFSNSSSRVGFNS